MEEDIWKGKEVEVFEKIGPTITDKTLAKLEAKFLVRLLGYSGGLVLGSRAGQVLLAEEERFKGKTRE